jgi:MtN3 and saliva related transmembrane protein
MHEFVGWLGAFFFATCALPQAVKTWRTRKANDLSWIFLLFWFAGEILTFAYIIFDDLGSRVFHWPLYVNYAFNTVLVVYLIYAKKYYETPLGESSP